MPQELKVIFFGATGMVGAAVLDTCLRNPDVVAVLSVSRSSCGRQDPKLTELLLPDLFHYDAVLDQLKGHNACLFTLGVTSAGMNEADYSRVTVDLTLAAARAVLSVNPEPAFCFISGGGSDETGTSKLMWARVKGRAENALLALPFRHAVMFRLGGLVALKGFRSKTAWIRATYAVLGPLMPLLARLFPKAVTTPQILGTAMIRGAQGLAPKARLESADIDALGR